jgi:hypothetical protein
MLHAGANMATPASRRTLGHLGHLGHRFKLHGHAGQPVAIGSFGSFILHSQSDPKHGPCARAGFRSLGHLGHLVIDLKLARVAALAWPYSLLGINPYIKIFYFLNWKP